MVEKHDKTLLSEENPIHTSLLEKSKENREKKRRNVSFDSNPNAAQTTFIGCKKDNIAFLLTEDAKEETFYLTKPLIIDDLKFLKENFRENNNLVNISV